MKLHALTPALIVGALLFGGCGTDQPAKPSPTPVATSSAASNPEADKQAIRSAFERYRQELLAGNGTAIPDIVSGNTVDYYAEMGRLAASAGPAELAGKSLAERFTVARLRVDMPADQLATMDGPAMLAYGVDQGYIDESSVADNQLGDIRIEGDRGFAQLVAHGRPTDIAFEFVRVGGEWKFDLAATMPVANTTFVEMARESGLTEDEFIFEMVEMLSGQRVDASIYNRP